MFVTQAAQEKNRHFDGGRVDRLAREAGQHPLDFMLDLSLSEGLDTLFTGWIDLFGGRQSARTIHFIAAWLIVAFVLIHVFQVIITGLWNNLRSMITGRYRIPAEASHE